MIIRCGLLLLFLSCVKTTKNNLNGNELVEANDLERLFSYTYWPSIHNGAKMMKFRKREIQDPNAANEGGDIKLNGNAPIPSPAPVQPSNLVPNSNSTANVAAPAVNVTLNNKPGTATTKNTTSNNTDIVVVQSVSGNETKHNETTVKTMPVDLSNPGVFMRALIVFGGFALMAGAYLIFYKRKGTNNDTNSAHGINDANQFRYGILQSDDRRENLELSRVPLTMESDEDEDDDLEIFDLEQKKKSLSYVNLQTNDEDIVFSNTDQGNDRDNLLLDIEDASLDTLINWSNNGNKSML